MKPRFILYLLITTLLLSNHIFASAEESWISNYDSTHKYMKKYIIKIINKNWIEKKPDKDSDISEYNINEAYEIYNVMTDLYISDYYKEKNTIEGIFTDKKFDLPHYWAVPAYTSSGKYGEILIDDNSDGYSVSDVIVYGNETNTYEQMSYSMIKDNINKYFDDFEVTKGCVLICPNYKISLIYVKTNDKKEYLIPYASLNSDVLKKMNYKEGECYAASEFIKKIEEHYSEFDVYKELIKPSEESDGPVLATGLMSGRNPYDPNADHTLEILSVVCILACLGAFGFIVFKYIQRKRGN
jgi:hypothetical protein